MLVTCPDCGAKISGLAEMCPWCGRPYAGYYSLEFQADLEKRKQKEKREKEEDAKFWMGCLFFLLIIGGVVYGIVYLLGGL